MISQEVIEQFLNGADPERYIVALEYDYASNAIYKIIQDPEKGKVIKKDTFTAFAWVGDLTNFNFYKKDKSAQKVAMQHCGIMIRKLRTDGNERMEKGMKYMVTSTKSYQHLIKFFRDGGLDPWAKKDPRRKNSYNGSDYITMLPPTEQYLVQKKKRLFKGFEEYDEIHRFVFDIETTSLDPQNGHIFLLGMKDNKGFEEVVEAWDDESERRLIIRFFKAIRELKPTIISGYNSAFFDFPYIMGRAAILGLDTKDITTAINPNEHLKVKEGQLKLGGEVEPYNQYKLWGFNIIDIAHSVRKAQAINSEIKSWSLKYITKFIEKEKPNRVYVEGDKIYQVFFENKTYYMNEKTGGYRSLDDPQCNLLTESMIAKLKLWTGRQVVTQYLYDDLWETMIVDSNYNQATFLLSKLVPTTYERISTMGTASLWKLIMLTWSYENELAIPLKDPQREFVGGLSRLVHVGYSKNIVKFDFSSLYPSIQLVYDVFPECDITGVMKSMLKYFRDTRILYKNLAGEYKDSDPLLSESYDRKQLPIKIFINGFFGSLSAPNIFPWADVNKGEQVTCTGRQSLRMMIMFFMKKGYKVLVMDTDGCNFTYPEEAENAEYVGKGLNELVKAGEVYKGVKAHVAEFNDTFMRGEMGLDIDYFAPSCINVARKNYAIKMLNKKYKGDDESKKYKIKLTGNSIKSKKLSDYMVEFLDKGIRLLLDGKGCEFIEYYYDYMSKIYNKEIPLSKIATKARVKQSVADYRKHITKTTKAGSLMSRQAHMELIMANNHPAGLGDTIFYINNGTKKSHGDVVKKDDVVKLNCYMISEQELQQDPNKVGDYNVPRYLSNFNKRIEPLLVCFHPDIRDSILVEDPKDRAYFTTTQCELVSGFPRKPEDQDDLDRDVLTMNDNELHFFEKMNIDPYYMYVENTVELVDAEWVSHNRNLLEDYKKAKTNLTLI